MLHEGHDGRLEMQERGRVDGLIHRRETVVSIGPSSSHRRQLTTLGQEHHQKHDTGRHHDPECQTRVVVLTGRDAGRHDPRHPERDGQSHGHADVQRLPVVLAHSPGPDSQQGDADHQQHVVGQRGHRIRGGRGAQTGACLLVHDHQAGRTVDQPLDGDDQLDGDGEEQEEALVGRTKIHPDVEAQEKNALHQEGCEY